MKVCINHPAEPMVINENHVAACWMNVKKGIEDGNIVLNSKADDIKEGGGQL